MIYLDNHQTTRPSSKVQETLERLMKENWIDIESLYFSDHKLLAEVENTYCVYYDVVGAKKEDQFFYTSGDAEAASMVFYSLFHEHIAKSGKNHLLTSVVENASILKTVDALENSGCQAEYIPVNEFGLITPEAVEEMINPRTSILALSWVNSLTGVIQPIWEIAKVCKKHDVLVYVQASEIFAKLFFRFQDLDIDFLSFSGDKLHGPRGSGGLFVKKEIEMNPLKQGKKLENLPSFIALGVAFKDMLGFMDSMGTEVARLCSLFEDSLKEKIPELIFFGQEVNRVPNTTCFAIPGIHSDLLLFYLKEKKIFATSGGGERQKLEYILSSMGVTPLLAKGAISCTLSMFTTESEIEKAVNGIFEIVKKLKRCAYV